MMLFRLTLRSTRITLCVILYGLIGSLHWIAMLVFRRARSARQTLIGNYYASFCRTLGATFIKAGQIVATRPDLASTPLRRALGRLHDSVGPFAYTRVRQTLIEDFGDSPEVLFAELDPYPVASASVAQVHRGKLGDGREIALKVLRPGIERIVACDLALMAFWARALGWIPALRALSPAAMVRSFGEAIWQQLDLRVEAENNRAFADNFAATPDVRVPALVGSLCSKRVLCMEFVRGNKILDEQVGCECAEQVVRTGFRMVLKMVFIDGLIHADLHPGNVLVVDGRLVLLDVGLVARISDRHRQGLLALLTAWVAKDVDGVCAAIAKAAFYDQPPARPLALRRDVCRLLERYANVTLADIEIGDLLGDLLKMVRRQWARLDPVFTMIVLAIGVVEGVGKELAPQLKLVEEAMPFVADAVNSQPSTSTVA